MRSRNNMSRPTRYTVAIIGAGRIGSGFDTPSSPEALTHAHAFSQNSRTELVALVDTSAQRCEAEAKRWHTAAYSDIASVFVSVQPDIVVIATPDDTHADLLVQTAAYKPRLIICEKPVIVASDDVEQVRAATRGIPMLVNFRRRFDPTVRKIAQDILAGRCGNTIAAHGTYVRGALHNGSHMLDLARMLFGEIKSVQAWGTIADYATQDPTKGGFISLERCSRFYLTPADGRHYSIFELDILTEKYRMRFVDEGTTLVVQEAIEDPTFKGFRTLGKERVEQTGLADSMRALASHAVAVLDGTELSCSTLENALKTHEACIRLLD
jgi:predicted dehydrogenase